MNITQPHKVFVYEGYDFDTETTTATFRYSFDSSRHFVESVIFQDFRKDYDAHVLDAALRLSFMLVGLSYYKLFPVKKLEFKTGGLDEATAALLTQTFSHGLSQFLFENTLTAGVLPTFSPIESPAQPLAYKGAGILALQSGGKDSLLTATMLEKSNKKYTPWYMQYGETYPSVLDMLATPPRTMRRHIDLAAINQATQQGGLNGHVPVTYMVMSFALIDAILHNENTILVSNGAEGQEAHEYIGDLPVNHQWAKTWEAEQLFAGYVHSNISPDIHVGSPLRSLSELRIVELFSVAAWPRFGHEFSSCNLANYKQGADNRTLAWDGTCPKCANAFLLFAPFIEPSELAAVIGGNLFANPALTQTFKGLLGIDDVMKPFECVGETTELRLAYHMARDTWGEATYSLPFAVPSSDFDYQHGYESQSWAAAFLKV